MNAHRRWLVRLGSGALLMGLGVAFAPGCIFALTQVSVGQGTGSTGSVSGTLSVPTCWSGPFDLQPDFFAGVPYMNTFDIRVQRGSDFQTFSDGLEILVDNVHVIRPDNGPGLFGQPLTVSLPAGVTPPGVPLAPNPNPAQVHMSLYLQSTCETQDVALYAMDQVSLGPDGTCQVDGGFVQIQCGQVPSADAGADAASAEGGAPIGHSMITFTSLFDDNPDETSAAERLTSATFHVYLADPRDECPGGIGPPPPCRGDLTGNFSFFFQRGQPAQPFP